MDLKQKNQIYAAIYFTLHHQMFVPVLYPSRWSFFAQPSSIIIITIYSFPLQNGNIMVLFFNLIHFLQGRPTIFKHNLFFYTPAWTWNNKFYYFLHPLNDPLMFQNLNCSSHFTWKLRHLLNYLLAPWKKIIRFM